MPARYGQPSFSGGELAPVLHSRSDLEKYLTGLATCRNIFIHPHGGASNRAGTEFVVETKDSTKTSILVRFQFNTQDTYMLEVGEYYVRVIRNGGQVLLPSAPAAYNAGTTYAKTDHVSYGGVNYYSKVDGNIGNQPDISPTQWYALTDDVVEIPTPYTEAQLSGLYFVQSADVLTLVHRSHAPMELSRTDHHLWSLDTITFAPQVAAPGSPVATPTGSGSAPYAYVITAIAEETFEESLASAEATCNNAATLSASAYNTITFAAVTGATKYNIYKEENGLFGFIGATEDLTFKDDGYAPDLSDSPPGDRNPFSGADDYPDVVNYHEQRLTFAASNNDPQKIWQSQTGLFHNMNVSSPQRADDAITIRIDAAQVNEVEHLISLNDLLVLTSGGEFKATSGDRAWSFENVRVKPQGYRGASPLHPLVIGNTVLYVQPKGTVVRDMTYALESDSYTGNNLSVLSSHLFEGHTVDAWAYAQEPNSIVWCVRDDGVLLGLTYLREHEVWAWHRHDTEGLFEQVASVTEANEDAVYFIVNRTINGQTKRYIERLHARVDDPATPEDCFFVDCGLTYDGAAATTIIGLGHLEGEQVAVLADGHVITPMPTVTGGQITLDVAASTVQIGLQYLSDLESLEPPTQDGAGSPKSAVSTKIRVYNTRGGWAGPTFDDLKEIKQREEWDDPAAIRTGEFDVILDNDWENYGKVCIRQSDPLPMTILAIIGDVAVGR